MTDTAAPGAGAAVRSMILLLALVRAHSGIWTWVPGLLLFGAGVGIMLTSSVNVVQSSFPDADQGDISGLSRSVFDLGSSFGTALVGSILAAVRLPAGQPFAVALTMLLVFTLIGLVLGVLIPRQPVRATEPADWPCIRDMTGTVMRITTLVGRRAAPVHELVQLGAQLERLGKDGTAMADSRAKRIAELIKAAAGQAGLGLRASRASAYPSSEAWTWRCKQVLRVQGTPGAGTRAPRMR